MKIPDHLVHDVHELALANLAQAIENVRVISATPASNGEHAAKAHERLRRARELSALFDRPGTAVA